MKNLLLVVTLMICGCAQPPQFSLAWSEYPSWSVFGAAHEFGLVDGRAGYQGSVEKKHNVDIVLKQADYDACMTLYSSGSVDASCLTNIDSLPQCIGRRGTIIMPTSTSVGGDACIVKKGIKFEDLENGIATYGLEKSVSQYAFEECLRKRSMDSSKYVFKNMDPAAASQAMQQGQDKIDSIMVWNPFVLQTLRTQSNCTVLFDSSMIPEEIIDCILVGNDSLKKDGSDRFAAAVMETFYSVCKMMENNTTSDKTYVALGAKFSSLNAEDMKLVCTQTKFYSSPDAAIKLFESTEFRGKTIPKILKFCQDHGMLDSTPSVTFDSDTGNLNFTTAYLVKAK